MLTGGRFVKIALLCLIALLATAIGYSVVGNWDQSAKEAQIDAFGQAEVPTLHYHPARGARPKAESTGPDIGGASTPTAPPPPQSDAPEAGPESPPVEAVADASPVPASPQTTPPSTATLNERAIRSCVNRERRAQGVAPLQLGIPLIRAARAHARSMARLGYFGHTDPQEGGPAERVEHFDRAHRFTYIGENIAAGYESAATACQGWMQSSGHRQNILNPEYTHIGIGFGRGGPFGRYYVQVFGAPSP